MNYYLKCFKNYADFSGRATRKEYWSFTLVNSLIIGILFGLSTYAESNMYDYWGVNISMYYLSLSLLILLIVWSVVIFIPSLSVTVRRLHDVGKSGWYILLSLVPYANIVVFVWTLKDSDPFENEYGPNPKIENDIYAATPQYQSATANQKTSNTERQARTQGNQKAQTPIACATQKSQQTKTNEANSWARAGLKIEDKSDSSSENSLCPVCSRENYRENNYCKWCGATFDANNNVIQGQKTRPEKYFRNIWNISNVVKYSTLNHPLNMTFMNYIFNNFQDCQLKTGIEVNSIISLAPDYAMPFNFLLIKGDVKLAVILIEKNRYERYSVLETRELCKENNIKILSFCIDCENEEKYVVNRMRNMLES